MSDGERGERVQKILARAGVASRRKAEELIQAGRVTVNGKTVELGARADVAVDWIKVDGKAISTPQQHRYLLLNKPAGYLTTLSDPEGRRTVIDLVPPRFRKALIPVGRLDLQTEGLLLLTTDGDLAQRIGHPRYGCTKTYRAKVRGVPGEKELTKLRQGIVLQGRRTAPARVEPHRPSQQRRSLQTNSWWTVTLREGRNRQIREMFERVGHPVLKLRRVAIGPLTDTGLPTGACRELDDEELAALRRSLAEPARERGGGKAR